MPVDSAEGGGMMETSFYENILTLQAAVLRLHDRMDKLERRLTIVSASEAGREIYGISNQQEIEELRTMRKEVVVAYATLEVDGPNTRTVERLLHKALYPKGKLS